MIGFHVELHEELVEQLYARGTPITIDGDFLTIDGKRLVIGRTPDETEDLREKAIRCYSDPDNAAEASAKLVRAAAGEQFHARVMSLAATYATADAMTAAMGRAPSDDDTKDALRAIAIAVSKLAGKIADAAGLSDEKLETLDASDPSIGRATATINGVEVGPIGQARRRRLMRILTWRIEHSNAERNGMLELDSHLVDALDSLGPNVANSTENRRRKAKERWSKRDSVPFVEGAEHVGGDVWKLWVDPTQPEHPFLDILSEAAWLGIVRPKLEQASKRSALVATIPAFIANDLRNIAGAKRAELASPESSGSPRIYADGNATSLVLASLQSIQAISAERLVELASGSYFWPTLHWIAATVRDQEFGGAIDPHIIRVEGGKEGLRREIGGSKDGGADGIWSVLSALHLLSSASEPGTGRMLTLIEQRRASPNGGRPITIVVIEVHLLMRPRAAKALGLHFPDWSLPIFDPGLVQTIGDHRTKGRQINAAQSLAQHIHDRRRDVASDGSFVLTKKEWIDLGNRAGLYDRSHASLRDRYLDSLFEPPPRQRPLAFGRSVGTEPMLVRVGPDRYRLGDSFAPEWDHFAEQGKITLASSANGKKSARKRAAQVERALTPRTPRRRR